MYYFLPQPPVFLFIVGLFVAITSGAAFEASLKQLVGQWRTTEDAPSPLQSFRLKFPFFGICLGTTIFLAAGLESFGYNRLISYGVAIAITLVMISLVWPQLEEVLQQYKSGGSKAIDLDSYQ